MSNSPSLFNSIILTSHTASLVDEIVKNIDDTAKRIEDKERNSPIHQYVATQLSRIGETIKLASEGRESPISLKDVLSAQVTPVQDLLGDLPEETSEIQRVAHLISRAADNVHSDIRNSPILRSSTPAPKKKPAESIAIHNEKAAKAIPLQKATSAEFSYYPKTHKERESFRTKATVCGPTKRWPIRDMVSLVEAPLKSCSAILSKAKGNRDYMEDFTTAFTLVFTVNGKEHQADVAAVCDGHGGIEAAAFVMEKLESTLKAQLEGRKEINQDEIYGALKETVRELHRQFLQKGVLGGTTAVIAFVFQDEIYVANIGDSRAFLNRGGKLIPMSIDQKPLGIRLPGIETGTELNEYASVLLKKMQLQYVEDEDIDYNLEQDVIEKTKMVVHRYKQINDIDYMILGIQNVRHVDMARSIGDGMWERYLKRSPEIFCQKYLPGDQLILHSDGVPTSSQDIIDIIEQEKAEGCEMKETAIRLVQASIPHEDNATLVMLQFGSTPYGKQE